jgi:hypothetical protein
MPVAPPVITAVFPFSLVTPCILRWICTEAGICSHPRFTNEDGGAGVPKKSNDV